MFDCTIVILTYRGKHHLEYLLPTLQEAIQNYNGNWKIEVLIVDNGRDELTKKYTHEYFPEFKYEFSPLNDYLFSLNSFVKNLASKYMLLLNDDMKLDKEIFINLIPVVESDSSLFAVTCNVMDWDGFCPTHGIRDMSIKKGLIVHYWKNYKFENEDLYYTLYPAGGAAIFNVDKFNQLGGFDPLFRPAYCEDADIGINAWYRGWPTIFSPKSIIYHREGGTINGQFELKNLNRLQIRNMIIWSLKNNKAPFAKEIFYLMLPYRLIIYLAVNRNYFFAMLSALKRFRISIEDHVTKPVITTSQLEILLKEKFKIDNSERNYLQRRKRVL